MNTDGSWRLVHHAATEFFRPVAVSGVRLSGSGGGDGGSSDGSSGGLEVHLTNDLPVDVTGGRGGRGAVGT